MSCIKHLDPKTQDKEERKQCHFISTSLKIDLISLCWQAQHIYPYIHIDLSLHGLNCRIPGTTICISLNNNSNYCYLPRSSKHTGTTQMAEPGILTCIWWGILRMPEPFLLNVMYIASSLSMCFDTWCRSCCIVRFLAVIAGFTPWRAFIVHTTQIIQCFVFWATFLVWRFDFMPLAFWFVVIKIKMLSVCSQRYILLAVLAKSPLFQGRVRIRRCWRSHVDLLEARGIWGFFNTYFVYAMFCVLAECQQRGLWGRGYVNSGLVRANRRRLFAKQSET